MFGWVVVDDSVMSDKTLENKIEEILTELKQVQEKLDHCIQEQTMLRTSIEKLDRGLDARIKQNAVARFS